MLTFTSQIYQSLKYVPLNELSGGGEGEGGMLSRNVMDPVGLLSDAKYFLTF